MIRWLLWDLDGTLVHWKSRWLIPRVVGLHFHFLAARHGFFRTLWHVGAAYRVMLQSRGPQLLNQVYLAELSRRLGLPSADLEAEELRFVREGLGELEGWIAPVPGARELFGELVEAGRYRMVAATNPTMPQLFNRLRLGWAGYDPDAFELITGTETCTCLKGGPQYFRELLTRLGARPEECLMVGNDGRKDLVASEVGIPVFLCRVGFERNLEGLERWPPAAQGSLADLRSFLSVAEGSPG